MHTGDRLSGFLVVAGADQLGARVLAVLSDHARLAGIRLMLMIDQPQGDLEKTVGTGGAVCIMKMYNHRDAAVAAELIGKGYKFVVNQVTRQAGQDLHRQRRGQFRRQHRLQLGLEAAPVRHRGRFTVPVGFSRARLDRDAQLVIG